MITRRALFSASFAGAALAGGKAEACAWSHNVYIPTESDRVRMFAYARRFCALFNRNEIEAIVGGHRNFNLRLPGRSFSDEQRVPGLRAFREGHGRILTPLSADNSLFWPEGTRFNFVAAMELTPPAEAILSLSCGDHIGGHEQWLFGLGFGVAHEGRRARHRLDIGWVDLSIGAWI